MIAVISLSLARARRGKVVIDLYSRIRSVTIQLRQKNYNIQVLNGIPVIFTFR
jgi:hypothetical protein